MDELSHYSPEPLFHEKEAIALEEEESSPNVVLKPVSLLVGEKKKAYQLSSSGAYTLQRA